MMVIIMTGNGHNIINAIQQYGLDEEDKEKIISILRDDNFNNIKTLVEKTLDGKDTPNNLSIISYGEENKEILKNQVIEALNDDKTIIAGNQEDINKIINSI